MNYSIRQPDPVVVEITEAVYAVAFATSVAAGEEVTQAHAAYDGSPQARLRMREAQLAQDRAIRRLTAASNDARDARRSRIVWADAPIAGE